MRAWQRMPAERSGCQSWVFRQVFKLDGDVVDAIQTLQKHVQQVCQQMAPCVNRVAQDDKCMSHLGPPSTCHELI